MIRIQLGSAYIIEMVFDVVQIAALGLLFSVHHTIFAPFPALLHCSCVLFVCLDRMFGSARSSFVVG